MLTHLAIEKVIGREIIDSRGNPTVEAEVTLTDGTALRPVNLRQSSFATATSPVSAERA